MTECVTSRLLAHELGFGLSLKRHDGDLFGFVTYLWQYKNIFLMILFIRYSLWIDIHIHEVGTSDTEKSRIFCNEQVALLVGDVENGISIQLKWSA